MFLHIIMCACRCQRLTLSVLLNRSPHYSLRQGLSLNIDRYRCFGWMGEPVRSRVLLSLPPQSRDHRSIPALYIGDPNPHAC